MMKLFTILILAWTALAFRSDDLTHDLKEGKIKIDLPNDSWFLAEKQEAGSMTIYFFKRKPIVDGEGRQIIPNISVIIEDVGKNADVISYSVLKRSKISFDILDVFTHEDGTINFENAVGYKGVYKDQNELGHTVFVIHALNAKKGLQVICDVTTNIFPDVEAEFLTALRSIRK